MTRIQKLKRASARVMAGFSTRASGMTRANPLKRASARVMVGFATRANAMEITNALKRVSARVIAGFAKMATGAKRLKRASVRAMTNRCLQRTKKTATVMPTIKFPEIADKNSQT